MTRSVVVVGGGLAGITAAVELAGQAEVTLLEARPRLGGAASSFSRGDLQIDTGQHVFLACYDAYRGLLHRLGTTEHAPVQHRFVVPVLADRGSTATLRRWPLPAPLHLLPALTSYSLVPVSERLRVARAAAVLRRMDPDDARHDAQSFGDWLDRQRQGRGAVAALWRLVTVAALNAEPEDASLGLAARVFRTGLLDRASAGDIGIPAVPLAALHADPAARYLRRHGVDVRVRTRVEAVTRAGAEFVVQTGSGPVPAAAAVVAVPHQAAARLLPDLPSGSGWAGLGATPIVNVHVVYDRPVMSLPFAAAVGSPVQWVFDRTRPAGLQRGQYLAVSVSAAHREIDTPSVALRATFLPALERLLPAARGVRVADFFVTRDRHATFQQAPGTAALRPTTRTTVPGLVLAGAWTATGWPDTMEGAVRSGQQAAQAALEHLRQLTRQDSAAA